MNRYILGWVLGVVVFIVLIPLMKGVEDRRVLTATPHSTANLGLETKSLSHTSLYEEEEVLPSFVICIDPGHQKHANTEQEPIGPGATKTKFKVTGGTTGVATNKPEYVLNLEASILLKERLEKKGFTVVMTRMTHDVDLSNKQRAAIANQAKADLFIRIHADGSQNPDQSGFSVLVPSKDSTRTRGLFEQSEKAAIEMIRHIEETNLTRVNGITYRGDITGFNWSNVPVILPELGFMTNAKDDQNLSDPRYLRELMQGIADGVESYRDKGTGSLSR
ncbi:N-acetylmuramoyl-L-alanine amidase [Pontibacillus salipaludis]|uniref:N-acetylmuramoyl-L-alanine amidase family protein n=1 Tax=Pontibacillus salipaludis TaxID=1697394 RepID=UPI0031E98B49